MKPKGKTAGERLKSLREHYKSRGVTAKVLSEIAGISPMQLNKMENDKVKSLNYETLKLIANALGSTVEWIEKGTGDPLPNGMVDVSAEQETTEGKDSPWKNEAWILAKTQLEKKDATIDRLSVAFERMTEFLSRVEGSFLHPVKETEFSSTGTYN